MRSTLSNCSSTTQPFAKAIVRYDNSNSQPSTTAWPDTTDPCANDDLSLTQPWYPVAPDQNPGTTITVNISATINGTGHFVWTMNGSPFRANYNNPVLLLSNAGNNSYPDDPEWNIYNVGSNSSVRIIFLNNSPAPHPMHLHGHTMSILNTGVGQWDGSIVNPNNPQRRDVQQLVVGGFLVVQFDLDNPGIWPFHCREFPVVTIIGYLLLIVYRHRMACIRRSLHQHNGASRRHCQIPVWPGCHPNLPRLGLLHQHRSPRRNRLWRVKISIGLVHMVLITKTRIRPNVGNRAKRGEPFLFRTVK